MDKYPVAIIGGGPAGICAAISAHRGGEKAVICEKMPKLGKKILATGNGRCNLLNDDLGVSHYNSVARNLVSSVLAQFGKEEILGFFSNLGLEVYSKEGRIFPVTNQAASVLKVLQMELGRLAVPVEHEFECTGISVSKSGILVSAKSGKNIECRRVIVTGGGMALPALGSDGSTYELARRLGHTVVPPVPSAVPLVVHDKVTRFLEGQRISAGAKSIIGGKQGKEARGELLFTKYGLSGTCILDISRDISVALNRDARSGVYVSLDLVPFMEREKLQGEIEKRLAKKLSPEEVLVGILPNKLCTAFKGIFEGSAGAAVDFLKGARFEVAATRGWTDAEYTSGGINVQEIDPATLESRLAKNVYFAGEVLDVDGERGGYNLAWAWASGFIAGRAR